MEGLQNQKTW